MSQYIGARYVPKFMGTYDNTQAYENMVVVDNGMGTSYISKVPVPAGTPLTDTNYWALYGASNGAIINLQNQIGDLSQLNTFDNSSLVAATNEVNSTINNYINDNDIVNRPTLFVGDSYGDGNDEFINATITAFGMTNAHNLSVSGEGFTAGRNDNGFLEQIQGYSGNKEEIQAIYVCGGLNDSHLNSMATLNNHIDAFVSYAAANYPNATLYLVYVGNARDGASATSGRTLYYREWCKHNYAQHIEFQYADLSGYLGMSNNYMASDGVHPSADGTTALRNALMNFMRYSLPKVHVPEVNCALTREAVATSIETISYEINGDLFSLLFSPQFGIKLAANTAVSATSIDVATFTELYFNKELAFDGLARFDDFDGKSYQDVHIHLALYQNKMSVCCTAMNSSGSGYEIHTASNGGGWIRMKGNNVLTCDANSVI